MPPKRTTPKGYEHGRELRKNPTPAEQKLWVRLRNRQVKGVKFRRQHAVGNYVPDFCAIKPKLIIELDGSQHFEQEEYDEERTEYLVSQGYQVLRFWNNQVLGDIEGVIKSIVSTLESNERGEAGRDS